LELFTTKLYVAENPVA